MDWKEEECKLANGEKNIFKKWTKSSLEFFKLGSRVEARIMMFSDILSRMYLEEILKIILL
jgi:hypothetical protein